MLKKIAYQGFDFVEGGVCAVQGFEAAGIHCGLRKNKSKKDLALIYSKQLSNAAAVYTQNMVQGAPLIVTRTNLRNQKAQAIIVNSGNANTCNADGVEKATRMCELTAQALNIAPDDVIVASTGVIGQTLDIKPIEQHIDAVAGMMSQQGATDAAQAILTTDTHEKQVAVEFLLDGTVCRLSGMAKGSGMIHPNMATLLCFLTTDVLVDEIVLQKALSAVAEDTFNMVSVDGDTSTNDMVAILANGMAGNPKLDCIDTQAYQQFCDALYVVMMNLARMIAADGEGATKLVECVVLGAQSKQAAKKIAKSVIASNLLKCAMFGADANWGRILCAVGYSGAALKTNGVDITFKSEAGCIQVCKNGTGMAVDEEKAAEILKQSEVAIVIQLQDGQDHAVAFGCDLTYDYVKINGAYRT